MTTPWFTREYDAMASITQLKLAVGHVFVQATKPVQHVAVVLRSDSQTAAESFHVYEVGHELVVEWREGSHIDGHHIVEVYVPPETIEAIAFSSSDVATIRPNVFRRSVDAKLSIVSTGMGSLLVDDVELKAGSIHLRHTGPGLMQLTFETTVLAAYEFDINDAGSGKLAVVAPSIAAKSIILSNSKSGSTQVLAKSTLKVTELIDIRNSGSGTISLQADQLTALELKFASSGFGNTDVLAQSDFYAASVTTAVAGAGSVKYHGVGKIDTQHIAISGSGSVSTNVVAASCDVALSGTGSVFLNKDQTYQVAETGAGKVQPLNPHDVVLKLIDVDVTILPRPTYDEEPTD
ncbi:hypothetical protein LEN26_006115 [Aphanomyces euteiches]|nr:hypothetical protein LEN26_006115 [Aphanomyces euteiches]